MREPLLRLHHDDLIVDNFAGGGGASLGIELALGRSPDIAVNHDPEAVAMHAANHPRTRHLCGDGRPLSKTAQVRMCGNSVCPPIAAALVSANVAREEAAVA